MCGRPTARRRVEGVLDDHGAETGYTYLLDERNGLLRIAPDAVGSGFAAGTHINVEGYYTDWVADQDLKFHIDQHRSPSTATASRSGRWTRSATSRPT